MKKIILAISIAALLCGCATTKVDSLSVANRSVKFSILNVIVFEKTTEGLEVGGAEIIEE